MLGAFCPRIAARILLPGSLVVLAPYALATSVRPPTPYAPPQAVTRLAGPYVLWTVVERDGATLRLECAVQLTDGDVDYARSDEGPGPGTMADPFYLAETDGGQPCTERVFKPHGIDSAIIGAWSVGTGGSIRLLQAVADPMDFRPGMVPGEYALAGGKVYLAALRAPSTAGAEIASPLGGPGFGYVASRPDGWSAAADMVSASLAVASPGSVPEASPELASMPNLASMPSGQAGCYVQRQPSGRGYGVSVSTQDELNALAREMAATSQDVFTRPARAPNLKMEAVERDSVVAIQRTWTGTDQSDPLVLIELEWSTPDYTVRAGCAAGAAEGAPLSKEIASFIAALGPDTR